MYFLLILAAIGTLFIPMPRWLSFLLSFAFIGIGIIFVLFGWGGTYWDSHMRPSTESAAKPMLITGVILLVSRAVAIIKTIFAIATDPHP